MKVQQRFIVGAMLPSDMCLGKLQGPVNSNGVFARGVRCVGDRL